MKKNNAKKTTKIIPIFFATDDNYVPFLAVALKSIIENASENYLYKIHILITKLSDRNMKVLSGLAKDNFEIQFVDIAANVKLLENDLYTRDYYTNTTYYRFFIANIFPQYKKALYLDSDIVVQGDISKLFNNPLFNNLVGAVQEEVMYMNETFINYTKLVVGVDTAKYFNAGILLMNLELFRKENIFHKFIDLLQKVKFPVAQDQDYLNVLCKNRVIYFTYAWNKTPIKHRLYTNKNVKLVHFKLTLKPWHYNGIMFEDIFWKYAKMTEFYDDLLFMRESYSAENKKKDELGFINLIKTAKKENCLAYNRLKTYEEEDANRIYQPARVY